MFRNYSDPHKNTAERINLHVCEPDLSGFIFSCIKVHLRLVQYVYKLHPSVKDRLS
jgi:hypothetical protein